MTPTVKVHIVDKCWPCNATSMHNHIILKKIVLPETINITQYDILPDQVVSCIASIEDMNDIFGNKEAGSQIGSRPIMC